MLLVLPVVVTVAVGEVILRGNSLNLSCLSLPRPFGCLGWLELLRPFGPGPAGPCFALLPFTTADAGRRRRGGFRRLAKPLVFGTFQSCS
jgi:hypothetical protein